MATRKRKKLKFDPASFDSLVKGMDPEDIQLSFLSHIKHTLAKDQYTATPHDKYIGLSYAIRDLLMERWIKTQQTYHHKICKRVLLPLTGIPHRTHPGQCHPESGSREYRRRSDV